MFYYFVISERMSFNFAQVIHQNFFAKNFYCAGGWWTVDSLGPLIFLNFKYVNNKVIKLLKIVKKFGTNSSMGLKIWDEVGVGGPLFSKIQQVGEFLYFWSKSMISHKENKNSFPNFLSWSKVPYKYQGNFKKRTPECIVTAL